ncbi:glutamyl-tRNA(Gln) amidotransferase subunit C, mitochondrial isoform 1-T1 [Mantella aurantiaca]
MWMQKAVFGCWRAAGSIRLSSSQSKVPQHPTWGIDPEPESQDSHVTPELIDHLERLALVDFRNQEGVQRLQSAIHFANQLLSVNTDGIEPLASVLEDRAMYIRSDTVTSGSCSETLLQNASSVVEDYFVAPPGNIPLPQKENEYLSSNGEDV